MLIAAGGAREIAQACALLSERHFLPPRTASTTSDLLSALDDWRDVPPHVQRVADEIERICDGSRAQPDRSSFAERRFPPRDPRRLSRSRRAAARAGLAERPARVRRRARRSRRRAASATASSWSRSTSSTRQRATSRIAAERRAIRIASRVEREWLHADRVGHRSSLRRGRAARSGRRSSIATTRWCSREHPVPVDPEIAARAAGRGLARARPARRGRRRLLRRLRFAGHDVDVDDARPHRRVRRALARRRAASRARCRPTLLRALDRDAPESLARPERPHGTRSSISDDGRSRRR